MKRRVLSLMLGLTLLAGLLTGCGTYTESSGTPSSASKTEVQEGTESGQKTEEETQQAPEGTAEGSGSLTFVSTEPNTLNMIQSASNLDEAVFYLISAMLYRPYDGIAYPELSDGYTVSEDNKTYTYTIKDATYSDGTPIVAADFVYYMLHTLDSATASYYKNGTEFYEGNCEASEVGIYAVDDKTFVVELAEAIADFDPELQIYPLQQEFAESKGDSLGGTPDDLMYSGPYVLKEWVYGSYLTFEKNPAYIDAKSSFQVAQLKLIHSTDDSAKYAMFTAGEADILTSTSQENYELMPDKCTHSETAAVQGLQFNATGYYYDGTTFVEKDPEVTALLANQNFRLALSYALNREAIVNVVNPSGRAYNRYISTLSAGNKEDSKFVDDYAIDSVPLSGDEAKAREYLATAMDELGYKDVSELPAVKYLTFDSDKYRLFAETAQSEWKKVLGINNIQIELQPVSDAVMSMVFLNYDIYYQSLNMEPSNPRLSLEYWVTGGGVTDAMGAGTPFSSIFSDAAFDETVAKAKTEFDREKRMALYAQAEQILIDSNIFIPVQINGGYYAVSDRVEGFINNEADSAYEFNHVTLKD